MFDERKAIIYHTVRKTTVQLLAVAEDQLHSKVSDNRNSTVALVHQIPGYWDAI